MGDQTIDLRQIATPKGLPQTGGNRVYVKSDNQLYVLDASGTEHVSGGAETLAASIIDAKGDLIVGTADNTPARLAVGTTDGQTLAVYSGATPGVKWVASSVPVILLAAGSGAGAVPANTPVGTIVLVKA